MTALRDSILGRLTASKVWPATEHVLHGFAADGHDVTAVREELVALRRDGLVVAVHVEGLGVEVVTTAEKHQATVDAGRPLGTVIPLGAGR